MGVCRSPTRAIFGKNVYQNERIGSGWTRLWKECNLETTEIKTPMYLNHWRIGGGGRARRTPSLWDPILSFSHTFSPKSAHVGGPCPPPNRCMPPPTGNPGSATVNELFCGICIFHVNGDIMITAIFIPIPFTCFNNLSNVEN